MELIHTLLTILEVMKTNRLFPIIAACVLLLMVVVAVILKKSSSTKNTVFSQRSENTNIQQSFNTNISQISEAPVATNETIGFYKTITDTKSDQYAIVNSEKDTVTLKSQNGNVVWSANVSEMLGTIQIIGERKINSMQMVGTNLAITIGKAVIVIDKQTGKVIPAGSGSN